MEITQVLVSDLIPYSNNARTHSDAQVAQIAASIKEFGWTNPVLVDGDNGVIAGHGRLLAARKLGMLQVPVIELSHLSQTQKKAYILADNKLAMNAGWDDEMLALELSELENMGFDMELTGFSLDEIANMSGTEQSKEVTEADYSEVLEVAVTCKNESEQELVYEMMLAKGFKCRILSI